MNLNTEDSTGFVPFARPSIGIEEEEAVLAVLRSGWLTTGGVAKKFEDAFSKALQVPYALAVNSATSGLHLALDVLGVKEGDWVISSPYTFTATVEIARYLGAHPLFVDIERDSFNIDPMLIERALEQSGKRVRCVIPVHVGGFPCNMRSICEIARRKKVAVVEDAAHAFPCRTNAGPAGTAGDFGVFSFYATKTITTGEGGMLVTSCGDFARQAGILRLHGIDREVWKRYQGDEPAAWEYDVVAPGYKYNLADLNAALGLCQLEKALDFRKRRESIARRYLEAFAEADFLRLPPEAPGHSWHLFVLCLKPDLMTVDRDEFLKALIERGVGASVHYKPLHLMSYYRDTYGLKAGDFPNSLERYLGAISLPIYPSMTNEQVEKVIREVMYLGGKYRRSNG
ncbi:MAG: DegT/DnrJ/EryC1/StrS family aminotransferase [Spirochaetales bacterium]|nr:DegT/DnrJ/EryC1/StrS family aminotransferase [Spirochaetales bacterium]